MSNPFRRPKGQPLVYGHRGARGVLPENTIGGFRYLSEIGAGAVEFDVQNAAGRVPVVVHDPLMPAQLARDPQGAWLREAGPKIRDMAVAEMQRYDVGRLNPDHAYSTRYPDQQPLDGARIPTLEEVLDWAQDADNMILNVEIKSYATRDDLGDPPAELVDAVLGALTRHGLRSRAVVSSFDWRILSELRRTAPDLARAYLSYAQAGPDCTIFEGSPWMDGLSLAEFGGSLPRLIASQGAQCWCPYFRDVTRETMAEVKAIDLAVNVWTVNEVADMRTMRALGVDGIITDYPARLQSVLSEAPAHPV